LVIAHAFVPGSQVPSVQIGYFVAVVSVGVRVGKRRQSGKPRWIATIAPTCLATAVAQGSLGEGLMF
jgi:hypothetical protein